MPDRRRSHSHPRLAPIPDPSFDEGINVQEVELVALDRSPHHPMESEGESLDDYIMHAVAAGAHTTEFG